MSKPAAKKPKHVSKTKQEFRRLRDFATQITRLVPEQRSPGFDVSIVRILVAGAKYALTGKKESA